MKEMMQGGTPHHQARRNPKCPQSILLMLSPYYNPAKRCFPCSILILGDCNILMHSKL